MIVRVEVLSGSAGPLDLSLNVFEGLLLPGYSPLDPRLRLIDGDLCLKGIHVDLESLAHAPEALGLMALIDL